MGSMKNWILGAVVMAGAACLGSIPAQAAQIGVYVGVHERYVSPSPGPGYFWTAGYYNGGYWVPGRWAIAGYGGRDRFVARDRYDRGRDWDRGRGWDRDHFRR